MSNTPRHVGASIDGPWRTDVMEDTPRTFRLVYTVAGQKLGVQTSLLDLALDRTVPLSTPLFGPFGLKGGSSASSDAGKSTNPDDSVSLFDLVLGGIAVDVLSTHPALIELGYRPLRQIVSLLRSKLDPKELLATPALIYGAKRPRRLIDILGSARRTSDSAALRGGTRPASSPNASGAATPRSSNRIDPACATSRRFSATATTAAISSMRTSFGGPAKPRPPPEKPEPAPTKAPPPVAERLLAPTKASRVRKSLNTERHDDEPYMKPRPAANYVDGGVRDDLKGPSERLTHPTRAFEVRADYMREQRQLFASQELKAWK